MKVLSRLKITAGLTDPTLKAVDKEIRKYLKQYSSLKRIKMTNVWDEQGGSFTLEVKNDDGLMGEPGYFVFDDEYQKPLLDFLEKLGKQYNCEIGCEFKVGTRGLGASWDYMEISVMSGLDRRWTEDEREAVVVELEKFWKKELNSSKPFFEKQPWMWYDGSCHPHEVKLPYKYLGSMMISAKGENGPIVYPRHIDSVISAHYVPSTKTVYFDEVRLQKNDDWEKIEKDIIKKVTDKDVELLYQLPHPIIPDIEIPKDCEYYCAPQFCWNYVCWHREYEKNLRLDEISEKQALEDLK